MKKNKMMRMASGLLVAALLTTSMISGTFAKYTTSDNGTDTARVAKWGVEITANGETFAKEYDDSTSPSVKSGTNDKVVAPGTSGTMTSMTLKGKPEVSVRVSYTGAFSLGTADTWKVGNDFYCPLVITVKNASGTTEIKQGGSINSQQAFEEAVNNAIAAYSKDYTPGTDLSGVGTDSLTVAWSWPYESSNDEKDTALGDATTAATVTLAVTTTVTQID